MANRGLGGSTMAAQMLAGNQFQGAKNAFDLLTAEQQAQIAQQGTLGALPTTSREASPVVEVLGGIGSVFGV
ncbi:MAG: hypothetical protein J2P50_05815 [Hyphomicrobiaceae bacterium]|nr:hypothetical protein [Hyphomicrobiaceae bacterium]